MLLLLRIKGLLLLRIKGLLLLLLLRIKGLLLLLLLRIKGLLLLLMTSSYLSTVVLGAGQEGRVHHRPTMCRHALQRKDDLDLL